MKSLSEVKPLLFKPDMQETAKRWEAFYNGDIIDRPVTLIFAKRKGYEGKRGYNTTHKERYFSNIDEIIDKLLASAEGTYYGGEAVPSFCPTLGPDEMAVFCGGKFVFDSGLTDTNWSHPYINDWETDLPLKIDENNEAYKRLIELYTKCAERMSGKIILAPIDLHSNMDLLAAARGAENLCMDLLDEPELITKAMLSSREIFKELWETIKTKGKMEQNGFYQQVYSHEGAATLQCDFSVMMSPESFNRWVIPALEEEAALVKHAIYHWDGMDALRHFEAIMNCKPLQTISFIPGAGAGPRGTGDHIEFVDLLEDMQKRGKSVHIWGTPEEIKIMHKQLDPTKVVYNTVVKTQDEADQFLEWMVKNT